MAKRSTFRLQTVLRLRKQAEDECRRRVAGRLRDIARAEMDIGEIEEQTRWEMERSRRDQLDSKMDVMAIRRRRGYMGFLHRRQGEYEESIRDMRGMLEADQRALAHASKEVKVLEKLRDRQWARQRLADQRAERMEEDEVGQQMFIRQLALSSG